MLPVSSWLATKEKLGGSYLKKKFKSVFFIISLLKAPVVEAILTAVFIFDEPQILYANVCNQVRLGESFF